MIAGFAIILSRYLLSIENDDEDPDVYDNASSTVDVENTRDSDVRETVNDLEVEDQTVSDLEVEDRKTEDSTRRNVYKTGRSQYTYAMAARKGLEKG